MSRLTEEQIQETRLALKRCSPETIEAALRFQETRDASAVPTIVYGIIERHMPPESPKKLAEATDDTELIRDLGVDSLTMLEIVLSIEETLGINIENDELREIRTLGAVKAFIERKLSGAGAASTSGGSKTRKLSREEIALILPQQPPFLFLDDAVIEGEKVTAHYHIRGDEQFLEGHFKDQPVFPATIVFEALGQAGCLWVLCANPGTSDARNDIVFASMEEAHFRRRALPGQTLELTMKVDRVRAPLAIFHGTVTVDGKRVAEVRRMTLAFGSGIAEQAEALSEDTAQETPCANGVHGSLPAVEHERIPELAKV